MKKHQKTYRYCKHCNYRTMQEIQNKEVMHEGFYFYRTECQICKLWNTFMDYEKNVEGSDEKIKS